MGLMTILDNSHISASSAFYSYIAPLLLTAIADQNLVQLARGLAK
jgi:hypothetical protein